MSEETQVYTFAQPVRGGYYYIVVKADSDEEAAHVAADVAGSFENLTSELRFLNQHSEGVLALELKMQERLDEFGHAHRFVPVRLRPYSERVGYRGFLPE